MSPAAATPAQPDNIVTLLARVSADVGAVRKGDTAPSQIGGYAFRGIDAVVNAVHPALVKHGVVVIPTVLDVHREVVQSGGGRAMKVVTVTTRFDFCGPAGDRLPVVVLGEASDAGDKATSKAQSVALRVALLQALMLPTDEPDPDTHNFERQHEAPPQQQPRQGPPPGWDQRAPSRLDQPQPQPHPPATGDAARAADPTQAVRDAEALQSDAQALCVRALSRKTVPTLAAVHEEARTAGLLRVLVKVPEGMFPLHEIIADKKQALERAASTPTPQEGS